MFSLLATTHDPENRFQKLNEIHRRRLSHWNCHTDSLTFVARSHHRHQALAMINNATNVSLVNWIVLWTLTHPILLIKALRLLIQLQNSRWVTDLCSIPTAFSVIHTDVRKSKKHIFGQKSPYPNFNVVMEKLLSKLQRLKTRSWCSSIYQWIGPLCLWSPVPPRLSEKVHNSPRIMVVWM